MRGWAKYEPPEENEMLNAEMQKEKRWVDLHNVAWRQTVARPLSSNHDPIAREVLMTHIRRIQSLTNLRPRK
jgi:hypothetical protein